MEGPLTCWVLLQSISLLLSAALIANVETFMSVRLFLLLVVSTWLVGCETEIEVIGPKRDVTVIYGLLESTASRHYVRINKAFVGEDSASVLAAESGINEYSEDEIMARVREYNDNREATGNEWELTRTIITDKQEGAFASDSNVVYYFDAALNPSYFYEIVCNVNVDGEDEKVVSATTDLLGELAANGTVEEVRLVKPALTGNNQGGPNGTDRTKDEVRLVVNSNYASQLKVEWSYVEDGFKFTSYARFYYTDFYDDGTKVRDSVLLPVGSAGFTESNISFSVNTEDWYAAIGTAVPDFDPNGGYVRQASDTLQFFLDVANEELSTYIEINQPASGVLVDKPEYTNVSNGIGIFASRLLSTTRDKTTVLQSGRIMDNPSLEELLFSNLPDSPRHTANKGFTLPGRCNASSCGGG